MLSATSWKHQSLRFHLQKGWHYLVALSTCKQLKINKQVFCLPWVKCSCSHPLCIYKVTISASSDNLEASIEPFLLAKDGDVSLSPSAPWTKVKIANRCFFSVCKIPNFTFQHHEVTFHLCLWWQSGSINRPFLLAKEGDFALSACVCLASALQVVTRWWQFSVILAIFSDLAATINYLPLKSLTNNNTNAPLCQLSCRKILVCPSHQWTLFLWRYTHLLASTLVVLPRIGGVSEGIDDAKFDDGIVQWSHHT